MTRKSFKDKIKVTTGSIEKFCHNLKFVRLLSTAEFSDSRSDSTFLISEEDEVTDRGLVMIEKLDLSGMDQSVESKENESLPLISTPRKTDLPHSPRYENSPADRSYRRKSTESPRSFLNGQSSISSLPVISNKGNISDVLLCEESHLVVIATVNFPSESLRFGGPINVEDSQSGGNPRLRSHSADTRRAAFQQQSRPISEDNVEYQTWNSGTGNLRSSEVNFPSQQRRPASTTPWSNSEYYQSSRVIPSNQSFSEHLRERSPASGSALLDLLSRYPSAQHSVQNSTLLHPYIERINSESRPTTTKSYTYQSSSTDPNFPVIEYTVRSEDPSGGLRTSVYQNSSTPPQAFHQRIQTTFTTNGPITSTFLNSELNSTNPPDCYIDRAGVNNSSQKSSQSRNSSYSTTLPYPYKTSLTLPSEHLNSHHYNNDSTNFHKNPDHLELIAAHLLDDNMNRSTTEWSKSFEQLQNRFQRHGHEDLPNTTYSTSGSLTLPRRSHQNPIAKSSSSYEMNNSLLSQAVERKAAEAPEMRRSGALDNFWSQTISSRSPSPTIQRIPSSLTAAERLQLLQEPIDTEKRYPQRVGSGAGVAARKAELMKENKTETIEKPRSPLNPAFPTNSFLNFNELDNAVHELSRAARSNAFSTVKRVGGCAQFPTGEHALSPPPVSTVNIPIQRKFHSPSPTEDNSDSSSVYQIPTGLPHPKPKHNVKEQLYLAGIQIPSFQMTRSINKNSPNFPVPSTGSVASRITEFEKRPGTPTVNFTTTVRHQEQMLTPPMMTVTQTNGNMSPRSAVFRSKPVIHVDIGASNAQIYASPQTSAPFRQIQVHSVPVQKNQHQHDSSTHSMFDLKSNNVSAASATQIQADISPAKSTHLAELHVASPPKRTSSAPSNRLNYNIDANGNYGRKSVSQNDVNYSTERTIQSSPKSLASDFDLEFDNVLDEQYRPTKKVLPPVAKPPQPKLIAPKEPIYYPQGKPVSQIQNDAALRRVCDVFRSLPGQQCEFEHMAAVCEAAGLPLYWKMPIFIALTNDENRPATQVDFTSWWKAMTSVAHDEASRFVYTLTMGSRSYLLPDDLYHMLMDVIHTHPGLAFYRHATEFHDKYCQVVMTRIFWNDACSWSGRLTTERLRRGGVLEAIRNLEFEDDINKSLRYFSYEHFYVVYCKFWEIDTNHDLKIQKKDLAAHAGGALVPLVVDRIFSGAVCMTSNHEPLEEIDLSEFTQFLLAEEDKTHPTSIEYWFRILDLDGDGIVTLYDMEVFHSQIQKKLASEGIDSMAFPDVACQLIDMLNVDGGATSFRLRDLKKSPLRGRFINTFVNWRKFFVQESSEGSESPRIEDEGGQELTEWDRYCIEEYEAMMEDDQADAETISLNLEEDDSKASLAYHDLL